MKLALWETAHSIPCDCLSLLLLTPPTPLSLTCTQLLAVLINSCFVLYQGWASAALYPFACQMIDIGLLPAGEPPYYAEFQKAGGAHHH
jgi:hypothetical protein